MAEPGRARGLAAALLTASLMPLNSTMIAVAIPDIARELDSDPAMVTQALVATYLIAAIALQSPGGKLGDLVGHRRIFAVGQVSIGIGALLGYLAPSLTLLAGARLLIAAGGALVVPATVALLRTELPLDRRGRAFGTFGAVMALAAAAGPVLGGVLVEHFGWESLFLVNVPVLALSVILGAGVRHRSTTVRRTSFDWTGSTLLTGALVLLVVGAQRSDLLVGAAYVGAGIAALAPFVWWERRAEDPVVAFSLFAAVPFLAGTLLIALQNLVLYALLFELPLLLETRFGQGALETGQTLVFLMLAMVVTSLVAGRLTDRFGARPLAVTGSLLAVVAIALMLASDLTGPADVRPPLVLLGIGLGITGPAAQTASLSAVSSEQSGMAAGLSSTMRYLGGVIGIAILGRLVDFDGSRTAILSEHRAALVVFTCVLLAGLLCALALPGGRASPSAKRSAAAAEAA
ncbi:MAG: MFS transporter [Nocardioides sp.]